MTPLIVSDSCADLGLRAGVLIFRDLQISPSRRPLKDMVAEQLQECRSQYPSIEVLRSSPELAKFRDILTHVCVGKGRFSPSVENLYRLVLRRGTLPTINNLVDIYNLVSVRTRCSMGAHDLDRITTPVRLQPLSGSEFFIPLGRRELQPVNAGEFGYVDADDRLLCRLDVLQAEFSKVTLDTRNVLMIIEATTAHQPETIQQAHDEVIQWVIRFCGGSVEKPDRETDFRPD